MAGTVDVETGLEAPARPVGAEAEAPPRSLGLNALRHGLFVLGFLGVWEWASGRLIKPFWVSKPSRIAGALAEWAGTLEFWEHLGTTVSELCLGFLLGTALALVIGFVFGEFRRIGDFFDAYLAALYGVPRTALAPLFILWFGIGLGSKVAQAAIMCFFLVLFNTIAGLRAVDPELINMARVVGSTRLQILTKIKIPSAFPYIMTGIKVGLPNALIGAIVAEFISSNHGVGYLIMRASMSFDTAGLFAGIIVLATVVFIVNRILVRVERYVLRWRPEAH